MPFREVPMVETKEIVRLWLAGVAKKRIAARVGVDPKTVRHYVRAAERAGLRAGQGEVALTEEVLCAVLVGLHAGVRRERGTSWAVCIEHREFIRKYLDEGVRLTKVRKLLKRQGVLVTYATLHRFAVLELAFGRRAATVPVADCGPGEELQVDTGWVGYLQRDESGKRRRFRAWIFTAVLSRHRFAYPCFPESTASAIEAFEAAWIFFGGIFRVVVPDNTKAIIIEPDALHPRINRAFLEYAQARGFHIDAARVRSPQDKGRVERQIQYLRTSFFAARTFRDVADLNAQFEKWRDEIAHVRRVPGDAILTVGEAHEQERSYLIRLPEHPFETDLVRSVRSGKTPYVRFDRNLYSIPHPLVRKPLTLVVGAETLRVLDGEKEVAQHRRSYESGACVEDPSHIESLVEWKKAARELKGRDRLRAMVPETDAVFEVLALRGDNLGYHTARLLRLLDAYGVQELRQATRTALEREAYSSGSIAHVLEQRRRERGLKPPMQVDLPDDPRVRDLRVIPHRLEAYDALGQDDDERNI